MHRLNLRNANTGQSSGHPYAVAMEAAMLAPKAELSMFPWKEPKERIPLAVRQIRSFLRGASACFCLDGGVPTTRPSTLGDRVTPCSCRLA